ASCENENKTNQKASNFKAPDMNVKGEILNVTSSSNADTLDQDKSIYSISFEMIGNLMDGLLQMGSDGTVQKALAKEETVSEDGLIYTFKLRDDAYWANGDPVTAHDFVYAWQREVSPELASDYAYIMVDIAQIKNAKAVNSGQMDVNQLGVRALDDYTFQVELSTPVSYFDQLLYSCMFYPLNKKFVEKCGDSYGTSPDTFLSNGAFILTEYSPDATSVSMIKNTSYYDADKVKLAGLHYDIVKDGKKGLEMYKNGQIDLIELEPEMVDANKSSPEFTEVASGFLYYCSVNMKVEALNNVNMRRALTLAFDRADLVVNAKNNCRPAWTVVPSGFAFGPGGKDFTPDGVEFPEYCSYNPDLANAYLEKAKKELGQDEFTFKLSVAKNSSYSSAVEMKRQIEATLDGVNIEIDAIDGKIHNKLAAGDFELGITAWGPDYADPMTYMALWTTGNDTNYGDYSNPVYDAMIANCTDGELATKPVERWAMLKKAEELVMADAVIFPVYMKTNSDLIKANVKGVDFHAVSLPRVFKHASK
nr:peptide ABC transporter substrate-binding protein [Treponema sp.]